MSKLIYFNKELFQTQMRDLEKPREKLNAVMKAYNKTGFGPLTTDEVAALMGSPKTFLYGKITKGQDLHLQGVKIIPAKAFDFIEHPAGTAELIELIGANAVHPETITLFEIKGQEVKIKADTEATIKERNSHYTQTEIQDEAHAHLLAINEALGFFRKKGKFHNIETFMQDAYIGNNSHVGDIIPSPQFINDIK